MVTAVWSTWSAASSPESVTVPVGEATRLSLAASGTTPTAGTSVNLTITAQDNFGNTATSYTGSKNLTFSGASASPGGNAPTVANASGTAVAFGTATPITFTSGVASISGAKNGVMTLYKAGAASISVSDGTISTASPLAVTVADAALSKLVLAAETVTPATGAADPLTISAQDTYGNPATSYTGSKSLTFSGASASPGGNAPTVTNSSGTAVAFGTATPITFTAGVATSSGSLNGEMRIYKSGAASVVVTDGSLTSAAVTVTPTAAATRLSLAASGTTPTAGTSVNLTITAQDNFGNTATSYTGSKSLTFSGASASPGGNAPTVANASGTAVAFGTATPITFTSGVASISGAKNGVMTLYRAGAASISVTDGTISTASPLAVTVANAALSKLVLAAETVTPGGGRRRRPDDLRPGHLRQPRPSYTGSKSLTFSGAAASPAGNAPTVTNASGTAIAFGTATPIEFNAGVATTSGSLNGEMRLYKSGAASVKVTDGTLTSAAVTVTPAAAAVKFTLGASRRPRPPGRRQPDDHGPGQLRQHRHLLHRLQEPHLLGRLGEPGRQRADGRQRLGHGRRLRHLDPDHLHLRRGEHLGRQKRRDEGLPGGCGEHLGYRRLDRRGLSRGGDGLDGRSPKLVLAAETLTPAVGAADDLTVSAQDTYGNVVPSYTGAKSLTFSGAAASPAGNVPTVTNSSGEAIAFATAIPIEFEAGVSTTAGSLNGEMRLYKSGATSVKVGDGTLTSAIVTVTPPPGAASKFLLSSSASSLVAGATSNLTTTAQDAYGNTATSYAGSKGIVFSGAGTSAGGTTPTVVNAAGGAIVFGSETVLTFTAGVAAVASSKNGLFKPAKAEVASLSASDGTISTTSSPTVTVSPTSASKFAFTRVVASAGALGSPATSPVRPAASATRRRSRAGSR